MWAVGAVGVLEERNACGRWVWGEGGKRACGGGGEGGGGGVRAVRDVRAVRRGWSCWGSNRTLFSLLFFVSSEYGSMWAVGAVGVLEERNACGRWVWGEGGKRACGGGGEGGAGGEGSEGCEGGEGGEGGGGGGGGEGAEGGAGGRAGVRVGRGR